MKLRSTYNSLAAASVGIALASTLLLAGCSDSTQESATPPRLPPEEVTIPITPETQPEITPVIIVDPAPEPAPEPAPAPAPAPAPVADAMDIARSNGCLACHGVDKKILGPAFIDVAERYKDDPQAKEKLVDKIKDGGNGNWNDVTGGMPMPPYSSRVSDEDIKKMVDHILSLKP